jgi:hypothetical protein
MRGALLLALVLGTTACSIDMNIRMGRRPDIAALEQRLRIGQSSSDDVLAALGPPNGKGAAMLPVDSGPRVMWHYNYSESPVHMEIPGETRADPRTLSLFVFFDGDRYDGYLWFSSLK